MYMQRVITHHAKNIQIGNNNGLSRISANEEVFNQAAPAYQEALKESGYDHTLKFDNTQQNRGNKSNNRSRNITCFNPPFSETVSNQYW